MTFFPNLPNPNQSYCLVVGQEYLETFWPDLKAAQELYCSIAQALLEKESESTEREYTEHLPAEVLEAGIKSGRFIQVSVQYVHVVLFYSLQSILSIDI